jgi:hypothetical protein
MGQFAGVTTAEVTAPTEAEVMTFNTAKYQAYFEDARKRAQQAIDADESNAWLRIASKWLKRLAQAERLELINASFGQDAPPLDKSAK